MKKTRILVVEDEIIVAQDLQLTLTRLGYEAPPPVISGEAALACLESVRPDLVLMDIHLAGQMDGITTAERIRQRLDIPIIYLTAYSDQATLRRANITEPYGYILKPFEERELAIAIDIALYRHATERKLRQMERWLASTLRSMGDAVITTDLAGKVTFMNHIAENLTGWSQADGLGRRFDEVLNLVDEHTHAPIADLVQRVIHEDMVIEIGFHVLLLTRDGAELPLDDSATLIRDNSGKPIGVVVVFRDVSIRKEVEDQLRYSATHDALTGLPNRVLLLDRLAQAFEYVRRYPEHKFAVLLLDLDRFKTINDSLGHQAGDQVLVAVAQRLEKELRAPDTVARLGGDEFVILLVGIAHIRDALMVAERIQNDFKVPIKLDGREVSTEISIGIVLSDEHYKQPDEILRDADAALYQAKSSGRGRTIIFDANLHKRAMDSLCLESDLRRAVERNEFLFHYQPIISLASGRVCGLEALLRWQHPERGLLLPASFLEAADEAGLINEIEGQLLPEMCQQVLAWRTLSETGQALTISVNMSKRQFGQPEVVGQIAFVLAESGIDPQNLCLEITEGAFMEEAVTSRTLMRLHNLGVQLHVHNFGAGYSSLSILQHAPIDLLKIDRVFVQRLNAKRREKRAIVRTILLLARELKMGVIAEGIETTKQAVYLKTMGCLYGQGNLFSKPLQAKDVAALISPKGNHHSVAE